MKEIKTTDFDTTKTGAPDYIRASHLITIVTTEKLCLFCESFPLFV
jgi:hypothetical protein